MQGGFSLGTPTFCENHEMQVVSTKIFKCSHESHQRNSILVFMKLLWGGNQHFVQGAHKVQPMVLWEKNMTACTERYKPKFPFAAFGRFTRWCSRVTPGNSGISPGSAQGTMVLWFERQARSCLLYDYCFGPNILVHLKYSCNRSYRKLCERSTKLWAWKVQYYDSKWKVGNLSKRIRVNPNRGKEVQATQFKWNSFP